MYNNNQSGTCELQHLGFIITSGSALKVRWLLMINSRLPCIILYIYIYIYEMLDIVVTSVVLAEFALNNYGQID